MSKRMIRIEIEIDCGDIGCGDCRYWETPWLSFRCSLFKADLVQTDSAPMQLLRCEACKNAEVKPS